LTSGQDAEDEWEAAARMGRKAPEPSYFMSPSSSDQIISLLRTCQESRSVAIKNYMLLFPASSTWFSFSIDFLYLDFGMSPHVKSYKPRTFTTSIPKPVYRNPGISHYLRPTFDEQLAKKVKNIAIANTCSGHFLNRANFIEEFWTVFSGVENIVLADQLHSLCSEAKEELVWIRNQRDEIVSRLNELSDRNQKVEREKADSQCLTKLYLWSGTGHDVPQRDNEIDRFEQELERTAPISRLMPTITRNGITTANIKKRLIGICGSEDNFIQLDGLDVDFILGLHEYHGSLNQSQLLSFLEMALERRTTSCSKRPGLGCFIDEGTQLLVEHVPELLDKIDALGGGFENIRLREAEECIWN